MTLYSSKTPRDLNHDPKPYRYNNNRAIRQALNTMPVPAVHYTLDPRPEFDHVQHNAPNPILVQFREVGDPEFPDEWIPALLAMRTFGGLRAWDEPNAYFHVLTTATDAHIEHARRVLTRLAAFKGES